MKEQESLIGRRFGRLVVKERVENDKEGNAQYLCSCDCQNTIVVKESSLLDKSVRSCGCYNKVSKDKYKEYRSERPFKVWRYMLDRCYDVTHSAYMYYGAKGITVCTEWREDYTKFKKFLYDNGYDENAPFGECTLDRIDNSKGYSPDNCRIVSMKVQALNKTNNHRINYKGQFITVTEAAEMNGLENHQVFKRLDKGWSMDRALHQPLDETSIYTASNQTHTIAEWAKLMGVTDAVIRGRLKTHTMQEIYDEWEANDKTIVVNDYTVKYEVADGRTLNRTEWAQEIGVDVATLRKLLKEHTMQEIYDDYKVHNGRLSFIRCNTLEEANGEAKTRSEWAKTFGIATKTLRKLLKERTLQDLVEEFNKNGCIKMYSKGYNYHTADGITECTAWWARKLKVNECTLKNFLKKRSMQEIVDEYNKNGFLKVSDCSPKFYTVNGVTRSQKEWAEILNMSPSTLRYHLKKKTMQEIYDECTKKS